MNPLLTQRPQDAPPPGYKTCSKCGEAKPLDAFHLSQGKYRWSPCSACRKRWYRDHPEAIEQKKKWVAKNPNYFRQYNAQRNKRKTKEYFRLYYLNRKREKAEYQRAYRRKQPEMIRRHSRNRRARQRGAIENGGISESQWQEIIVIWRGRCAYCGKRPRLITMDHVVPLARGGKHCPENVVPACKSCNCSKQDNLPKRLQLRF